MAAQMPARYRRRHWGTPCLSPKLSKRTRGTSTARLPAIGIAERSKAANKNRRRARIAVSSRRRAITAANSRRRATTAASSCDCRSSQAVHPTAVGTNARPPGTWSRTTTAGAREEAAGAAAEAGTRAGAARPGRVAVLQQRWVAPSVAGVTAGGGAAGERHDALGLDLAAAPRAPWTGGPRRRKSDRALVVFRVTARNKQAKPAESDISVLRVSFSLWI